MGFRFLGNKGRLLPQILEQIAVAAPPGPRPLAVDLFCGTASVSTGLRELGYRVVANDLLRFCVIHAQVRLLLRREPIFPDLSRHAADELANAKPVRSFDTPYRRVLAHLNSLAPREEFFFREYSPGAVPANGARPRKYFTAENARRIDAIRGRIRCWSEKGWLTTMEQALLLHDLMQVVNDVANIAGTYGYFLGSWSQASRQPLLLTPSRFVDAAVDHQTIQGDALETAARTPADVYYLDPPYTKRQYAAYYHILETIAHQDEPEITGKSGLRPWEEKASDFCYKQRAAGAMRRLLEAIESRWIFVSYSEDGHIPHQEMMDLLSERGDVRVFEMEHPRYRSQPNVADSPVVERLYRVRTA